jgi:hypothetical protein
VIFNRSPLPTLLGQDVIARSSREPEGEVTNPKHYHVRGCIDTQIHQSVASRASPRCPSRRLRAVSGRTATVANGVEADGLDRRPSKREASSVAAGFRSHPLPISDVLLFKGGPFACRTTLHHQPLHLGDFPWDVSRGSSKTVTQRGCCSWTYCDESLDGSPKTRQ